MSPLLTIHRPLAPTRATECDQDSHQRGTCCPNAGTGMMEQRKKVPVFLRQAIRQGIGVTIAVLLGYAIADKPGGAPLLMLSYQS